MILLLLTTGGYPKAVESVTDIKAKEQPVEVKPVVQPKVKQHVNPKQLSKIFPKGKTEDINLAMDSFNANAEKYGITTETQKRIFFAQVLHEGAGEVFGKDENLNYSEATLKKVFKKFRDNPSLAKQYGRNKDHAANKEMIANIAYGDRMGNQGEGYKYRGMGALQITGKRNFDKIAKEMGITTEELVSNRENKQYQLEASMAYWKLNGLDKVKDMDSATRIINRHTKSYGERRDLYNKLGSVFKS